MRPTLHLLTGCSLAAVAAAGCTINRTIVVDRDDLQRLPATHGPIIVTRDDGEQRVAYPLELEPRDLDRVEPFAFAPVRAFAHHATLGDAITSWDGAGRWSDARLRVRVEEPGLIAAVLGGGALASLGGGLAGAYIADCRPDCREDTEGLSLFLGAMGGVVLGWIVGATIGSSIYTWSNDHAYEVQR